MADSAQLILFVDDQQVARKYFAVMFADEYEVLTAENAAQAWEMVQEYGNRLAVIITDQRMGEQSGVDLLMTVRQQYPHIVRLLTTGYADLAEAIDAVHRGDIHAYVPKPWNLEEFGVEIRRGVELYALQRERDSLQDTQARALKGAFAADRLRSYGLIAAACSGWVTRSLTATLALWSHCLSHGLNRQLPILGDPSSADPGSGAPQLADLDERASEHSGAMLERAGEVGRWLAANRSVGGLVVCDAADLALCVGEEMQVRVAGATPPVLLGMDSVLFTAGLRMLIRFFRACAALSGCRGSLNMELTRDQDRDFHLHLQWTWQPSEVPRQPTNAHLIAMESDGLKAYLAMYHHGAQIAIEQWDPAGARIHVHVPRYLPDPDDGAERAFQQAVAQPRDLLR